MSSGNDQCNNTMLTAETDWPVGWFVGALILITIFAAMTRLHELDRPSFWADEIRSIRASSMPEGSLRVRTIAHSPTALGLLAGGIDLAAIDPERPDTWRALGINEWNARIGSCIIGILTVPILILAGRRMLGTPATVLAGLLLALAPWHIQWSQAARFYTLQFLFYTLCLLWYFQWRNQRSKRMLVATIAALVLAFLSQPTALIAIGVIGIDLAVGVVRGEIKLLRRDIALLAMGSSVCVFLLGYYLLDHGDIWVKFIAFTGETRYQSPVPLFAGVLYMVQIPIVAIAVLTAVWMLPRHRSLAIFLMLAATVPLVVFMVWSLWNFVGLRYVLITLWWWLVLAAIGLTALYQAIAPLHGRVLASVPTVLLLAALFVPLYGYYKDGYGHRGRWREAVDFTLATMHPEEQIATTFNQLHLVQFYSGREDVQVMHWTLDEMVSEFEEPIWLIFQGKTSVGGVAQRWTRGATDLRAVFDMRIPQPIELVEVHRFQPAQAHREMQKAQAVHPK